MTNRIEIFKAAFLIFAFVAIGFGAGHWYAKTGMACPPVWYRI